MPPQLPAFPTRRSPGRHPPPLSTCPTEHQPVLAPELVALLAPEPGQTAVDCTFGGGGHARLLAERLGPEGTLICIDRDPAAEARFAAFAAAAPCRTRFIGTDYAEGLRTLRGEGIHPDMVYMDLGMSSMQVDAWERGFSYCLRRTARHADGHAPGADRRRHRQRVARVADRPGAAPLRRGALRRRHRARDRPPPAAAHHLRARRGGQSRHARPRPASAAAIPAKRTFQAIRIAVNGELDSLEDALPLAWEMLPIGGRLAAISFHSLEDRPRQAVPRRARPGCVCPPELPVCVCGHEPEAELLTRRAVAPGGRRDGSEPALALGPPAGRREDRRYSASGGQDD